MTENIVIGPNSLINATEAYRCVCLGPNSGIDITDQEYQFRFSVMGLDESDVEFSTTMTEDEWRVIFTVLKRALLKRTTTWRIML